MRYIPPDCNTYKMKVFPIYYRICKIFFSPSKGYAWKPAIWQEENQVIIYYLFQNYALTTACPKTTASCSEASKSLRRKGQSLPMSKYTYLKKSKTGNISNSVYFFAFQTYNLTISPSNHFHYCKNTNQTKPTKSLKRL